MRQLNAMPKAAFTAVLADIFEHSPWIAEGTAAARPFATVDALHHAMCAVMHQAGADAQLALLRAHPELAGKQAQDGALTASSAKEQSRAGLNALSADEMARITALNAAYALRHGFPFIVCVGQHSKASLFAEFERRAHTPRDLEWPEALRQVEAIARLRLQALISLP